MTKHSSEASGAERLRLLGIVVVRDEVTGLVHQGDRLVAVSTESGAETDTVRIELVYMAS